MPSLACESSSAHVLVDGTEQYAQSHGLSAPLLAP